MRTFATDVRSVLRPERKWHYLFHFIVIAVSLSYWLGSLKLHDASWPEIAIYRPAGDNEVFPVITALSRLNFGDPTDALHYGKGTAGSQVVILFPYSLAYAIFGVKGYILVDAILAWLHFAGVVILLRRCNFSNFSSLVLGSALATRSLQILCSKIGESIDAFLALFQTGTWEWGVPDLLDMQLVSGRIPRPIVTGIFVVLLLYFLLQQWQERRLPSFRRGLAIGSLLTLLLQGDPFSVSALGLLLLWVIGWTMAANAWRIPWHFISGGAMGTIVFGSYFLWQQIKQHPDSAMRFGLATFPRNKILFLPGYAPLIRVGVICVLASLVILAVRSLQKATSAHATEPGENKNISRVEKKTVKKTPALVAFHSQNKTPAEHLIATFCVALVCAAWLAQPIQLLLLGQGCQIYHYLLFTLPGLYSYAFIILFFTFIKLAIPELSPSLHRFGNQPHWTSIALLSLMLPLEIFVGMESKLKTVSSLKSARQDMNTPWANAGDQYRPAFRALDKEFRENPTLQQVRSFATFCYEVNFLLAAFYDKRAYLPDNAYSTLSDAELEDRLLETLKIMRLPEKELPTFLQINFILNYWLGCAKYWMASDHQYAPRSDYSGEQWENLQKQDKETPWLLCLPNSETTRLSKRYQEILTRDSDRESHPDAIIVGLEKSIGMIPNPNWYREFYTNELFSIYVKNSVLGLPDAAPTPNP